MPLFVQGARPENVLREVRLFQAAGSNFIFLQRSAALIARCVLIAQMLAHTTMWGFEVELVLETLLIPRGGRALGGYHGEVTLPRWCW
jgi:hypothetical protein